MSRLTRFRKAKDNATSKPSDASYRDDQADTDIPAVGDTTHFASTALQHDAKARDADTADDDIANDHRATDGHHDAELDATPESHSRPRRIAVLLLFAIALILACGAGYLKWAQASDVADSRAAAESLRAASDSAIAILSYEANSVENDLGKAVNRLTGEFKNAYTSLTHDVVIPGAKQQQITSTATVPAAASMSASENHATVLLFINQSVTMGQTPPSDMASTVKVTLDKVGEDWLISGFDPV